MHRCIAHLGNSEVGGSRLRSMRHPAERHISRMCHRTRRLTFRPLLRRIVAPLLRKIVVPQHAMIAFVKKWSGANIRQVFLNPITRLLGHAR